MGDLDSQHGETAAAFIQKMVVWDDHFYDKDVKELKKILAGPNKNRFMYIEHSWKQLKLPMSWYETQCSLVNYDTETIMREVELKRIHGSSMSPFKRTDLIYLMNHTKEPIETIDYSKNLCPILIYEKIKPNKVYIMAIDPSEGLAEDNNAMTLINPSEQTIAAEFRSPYISQPDFCRLLCKFLDDRCPRSLIIPESNKGREIINCFLETRYRDQVYFDDGKLDKKVVETTDPYGRLKAQSMQRRAFGIWTGTNRSQYYAILENIMEERKDILLSKYIVEDVCGLIRKPNGRIEAGKGSHDDNIMSYLIGMFVYTQAPYEKLESYGLRRGAFYSYGDEEDIDDNSEVAQLRKMIELLPSLPPDMQELIKSSLNEKNPVKESEEYFRTVAGYRSQRDIEMPDIGSNRSDEDYYPETQSPIDQNHWAEFDRMVLGSNEPTYNPPTFDIEDFI